MRFKQAMLISAAMIFILILGGIAVVIDNTLFHLSPRVFDRRKPVPRYDTFTFQHDAEMALIEQNFEETADEERLPKHDLSFDDPLVILNPYSWNPLSALVLFYNDTPRDIQVMIQGEDDATTLRYTHSIGTGLCQVPVLGLYPNKQNTVLLNDEQGNRKELSIKTGPIPGPLTFMQGKVFAKNSEFVITVSEASGGYLTILDQNAQIRGYSTNFDAAHQYFEILDSGNLLISRSEAGGFPAQSAELVEVNPMGRVFGQHFGNMDPPSVAPIDRVVLENGREYHLYPFTMYSPDSYAYDPEQIGTKRTGERLFSARQNMIATGSWYSDKLSLPVVRRYIEDECLVVELDLHKRRTVHTITLLLQSENEQLAFSACGRSEIRALWQIYLPDLSEKEYLLNFFVQGRYIDGEEFAYLLATPNKVSTGTQALEGGDLES